MTATVQNRPKVLAIILRAAEKVLRAHAPVVRCAPMTREQRRQREGAAASFADALESITGVAEELEHAATTEGAHG